MLKLRHFVFAVGVMCITNLVRIPAVTKYTRIFIWKKNKANQIHGNKKKCVMGKSSQFIFLGKGSLKTSSKNLRPKPLHNSYKEHYFANFATMMVLLLMK